MNDDLCGTCNANCQIKSKTTITKLQHCDYIDACIPVKGWISVEANAVDVAARKKDRLIK